MPFVLVFLYRCSVFSYPRSVFFREKQRKTYHKTPPQKWFSTPPSMVRFPLPCLSTPCHFAQRKRESDNTSCPPIRRFPSLVPSFRFLVPWFCLLYPRSGCGIQEISAQTTLLENHPFANPRRISLYSRTSNFRVNRGRVNRDVQLCTERLAKKGLPRQVSRPACKRRRNRELEEKIAHKPCIRERLNREVRTVNLALSASKVPVFQFTVCTSLFARP